MNQNQDLKMQLLKEFGISDEPKTIDFCREAYKFLIEGDTMKLVGYDENGAPIIEKTSFSPYNTTPKEITAVDLGLPSGTLWADRNIGAKSPEDFGLYFSWGNVEGHAIGSGCDFDEYNDTQGHDVGGELDTEHDAARFNLGEPWMMPTKEQFQELVDNCTSEWCCENGYVGRRFTSKINGNSVFFPAAGLGNGTSVNNVGSNGYYWSSSWDSADGAYNMNFDSSSVYPQNDNYRYLGFSVRAVQISPTK